MVDFGRLLDQEADFCFGFFIYVAGVALVLCFWCPCLSTTRDSLSVLSMSWALYTSRSLVWEKKCLYTVLPPKRNTSLSSVIDPWVWLSSS